MLNVAYCHRIEKIGIYLSADEDLLKTQVVNVTTHESFQAGEKPIPQGLYDPRMGAITSIYSCSTCQHNEKQCPGHFGYYKLNNTLIQPVVIEDILKWLKIICIKCGNLLIDHKKIKDIPSSKKLQVSAQLQLSEKICSKCGNIQPKFKHYEDNIFYIVMYSDNKMKTIRINDIRDIFSKISDETCILMGRSIKSHPKKYFYNYLPIPPITMRPHFKNSLTNKSHRTSPCMDFIKNIIRKDMSTSSPENEEKLNIFINKINFDMIRGGSQKKGDIRTNNVIGGPLGDAIIKQLGGKKGTIRNFQMAHRALSGSRITISGNPTLKVNEVGIPDFVVRTLQISETVREWNIHILYEDVVSGRCSRIKRIDTGTEHSINDYNKNDINLTFGDIIYRHIRKGDKCLFNRPPSLKESAIGCHNAVPFPYSSEHTFQTNVAVCVNYNADYDGDQMRLKALSTLRSQAEAEYISSIERWMLSSQKSLCVNGQVQDSVIGSALLTKSDVVLDKLHAMRLFSKADVENIPSFDKKEYTGREIISLLLKDTPISYKGKAKYYNPSYKNYIPYKDEDINVIIQKGEVKQGILDKSSIGDNSAGGVFHLIALEFGTKKALRILFSYQQIALKYLEFNGFTMGMDDLIISKEARSRIDRIISDQEMKSKLFAEEMSRGEIFPPMGISLNEYYEQQQLRRLTNDSSVFGSIITSIDQEKNGLFQMIMYGSKGKATNMMSIFAYVGQLQVEGERMANTFSHYRSSVYFPRFAMDPESKGFVRDPLSEGLDPKSMSYAGAQARQNIVQKSQSTAISGSNQRKHVKNMENTIVGSYHQVYKSYMQIQYLYGENGFDPRNLVKIKIDTISMSLKEIEENFYYKAKNKKLQKYFDEEIKYIKNDYEYYNKTAFKLESVGIFNNYPNKLFFGVYLDSTIDNMLTLKNNEENEIVDMIIIVKEYIDNIPYLYINFIQKEKKGYVPPYMKSACFTFQMLLRIKLNSKSTLIKTNKNLLLLSLDKISYKFVNNLISPGSCVGVMAAQSVGEPMTQMMLDAVHGSSSGASAGLEKSKEILSAKFPNNSTNSMWFKLKENIRSNKIEVNNIAEIIKSVKLKDFIDQYQIFKEEFGNPVHKDYKHEKKFINDFKANNPSLKLVIKQLSTWVIRLELNKISMIYKSISVEKIIEKLYINNNNLIIVYSTELDEKVILRIYIKENEFIKKINSLQHIENTLLPLIKNNLLRGINDILDTMVQPISVKRKNKKGDWLLNEEFMIRTVGVDMHGLSYIGNRLNIDMNSIHIGSVMDTYQFYGIEAARSRIIEQMISVMEGNSPSYHHLSIYADILTWSGQVKAIERAIRSEKNKILSMASGYSAGKVLMNAAAQGINESTDGITGPIMLGTIPNVGTKYCTLIIDEEFVKTNTISTNDIISKLGND